MNITIHLARNTDLPALRLIELRSFETLRQEGAVSGLPTAGSIEDFRKMQQQGLLLVAFSSNNIPVGFAGALFEDAWLHITEVDVLPDWQGFGIGRGLMMRLLDEGQSRGLNGATLTTDRYAPFNAPFYATLGFQRQKGDNIQQRLQRRLDDEVASGMDIERRIAMQLIY